jgi:spermidine/putrescine transport system permease protein
MRRFGLWGWRGFGVAVVVFMLTPLILVVLFSFGESAMTNFPMGGVTLKWFRELIHAREFWNAFNNSMIIAAVVALASTVIGTLAAMALARMRPTYSAPWLIALCLPVMLPPLVIGVALLVFFVRWIGVDLSLTTVILGHLVVTQPFVVLIVYARMATFDYTVVDSARDLGAGPWQVFWTVTLPIVRSTIIGAALIALAISLDEFIITFFNIGGGNTLPTFVFGKIRTTLDPTINAIATILIVLTVGSTVLALRLSRYRG